MTKDTIELHRETNFPYGYSRTNCPTSDSDEVLNAIIEWSRTKPGVKVYRHKLRSVYENDTGELYDFSKWVRHDSSVKTTKVDIVDYLDIYYQ